MRDEIHVSIIGLPGSGKTTLLAALWHMVREPGASIALSFDRLSIGNYEHLNQLAKRWRSGKIQQRTQVSGAKDVTMRLKSAFGRQVDLTFPDLPGEEFARMWERRELDPSMNNTLSAPALALLINGDTIRMPAWLVDQAALAKKIGMAKPTADPVDWSADLAPTQVRVVDLLQMLMSDRLYVGGRRLAILVSAWDKVEAEGLTPAALLESKLPLLHQYLTSARDPWTWRVWGLSAQGGVYEDPEKDQSFPETDKLRDFERPSDRIKVADEQEVSSDITKPLEWLVAG